MSRACGRNLALCGQRRSRGGLRGGLRSSANSTKTSPLLRAEGLGALPIAPQRDVPVLSGKRLCPPDVCACSTAMRSHTSHGSSSVKNRIPLGTPVPLTHTPCNLEQYSSDIAVQLLEGLCTRQLALPCVALLALRARSWMHVTVLAKPCLFTGCWSDSKTLHKPSLEHRRG